MLKSLCEIAYIGKRGDGSRRRDRRGTTKCRPPAKALARAADVLQLRSLVGRGRFGVTVTEKVRKQASCGGRAVRSLLFFTPPSPPPPPPTH